MEIFDFVYFVKLRMKYSMNVCRICQLRLIVTKFYEDPFVWQTKSLYWNRCISVPEGRFLSSMLIKRIISPMMKTAAFVRFHSNQIKLDIFTCLRMFVNQSIDRFVPISFSLNYSILSSLHDWNCVCLRIHSLELKIGSENA